MIVVNPANPRGIVWIASYPKSGNTWVRVFLYHLGRLTNGHPRAENDLHALDRVTGYEARFTGLFVKELGKPLSQASPQEVMNVRARVHATIAERADNIALVKTHNAQATVAGAPTINIGVSAGVIYLVRDPRDVVISLADHLGRDLDRTIEIMAERSALSEHNDDVAVELWSSWSENVRSWTEPRHDAVLVLRYEDMLDDPHREFRKVVKHMRLEPEDAHIDEAISLSEFGELAKQEQGIDFRERSERAERFFRVGKAGQWHDVLDPTQVRAIEYEHGEQMRIFGYLD